MTADILYTGGDIVTVYDAQPSADAVAVKDGKILAVGDRKMVHGLAGSRTRTVDLDGRTLMPGFIDPHSHYIYALTVANQVNVSAPPAGPAADVDGIVAEVAKFRDSRHVPKARPSTRPEPTLSAARPGPGSARATPALAV